MLDAAFIRDNLEAVKANCKNRNVEVDVARIVQLDDRRKALVSETQLLQQRGGSCPSLIGRGSPAAWRCRLRSAGFG